MNQNVGKVIGLFISQEGLEHRVEKNQLELNEDGILEDKFYGKNLNRSVLLTTVESYQLASAHGIEMPYGSLGENLLVDFNPYTLPIGTKIQIGSVIVEITQNCTICNHLSKIDKALPKLLEADRGIFVKVMKPGFITKSDGISLV